MCPNLVVYAMAIEESLSLSLSLSSTDRKFGTWAGMIETGRLSALYRPAVVSGLLVLALLSYGPKCTPSQGFPYGTYVTASCVLVMICIMGRRHGDDDNNNKMNHGLTWSSEEVKCLVSIWADGPICRLMDTETMKFIKARVDE